MTGKIDEGVEALLTDAVRRLEEAIGRQGQIVGFLQGVYATAVGTSPDGSQERMMSGLIRVAEEAGGRMAEVRTNLAINTPKIVEAFAEVDRLNEHLHEVHSCNCDASRDRREGDDG